MRYIDFDVETGNALCVGDDQEIATGAYGLALRLTATLVNNVVNNYSAVEQFQDAGNQARIREQVADAAAKQGGTGAARATLDARRAANEAADAFQQRDAFMASAHKLAAVAEHMARVAQSLAWCALQTAPNPLNGDPDDGAQVN